MDYAVIVSVLLAYFFVCRYNLHMFQLNGYKNKEHPAWLRKNKGKQYLLAVSLLLSCLLLITGNPVVKILFIFGNLLVLWYYLYLKRTNTKKKLNVTKRVARQITTTILCTILVGIISFFPVGLEKTGAVLGIWMVIFPVFVMAVNIINAPVEKAVNRYYINDAKKKLQSVPGLIVIGVTGSYGKTSVKFYLQELLSEKYHVLCTPESYNTPMGVVKTIRESLKPMHEIFICEMGARHVGDIKEICDIVHPHHGVITSIGPQHLDTFFNMENIIQTKFELADALPEDGMLFLNGDNAYIKEQGKKYSHVIFYGTETGNTYRAGEISVSALGTDFTVTTGTEERQSYQSRLVGGHNVINILAAIAVGNSLGIPLEALRVPVRRIQPVPHRMQLLDKGGLTIIDDAYNSNPVGSRAAVETLALFEGIRILITPGMVELGDKEEEYNRLFGTYAAACCDYILLVGSKRARPIEKGVLEAGFDRERCKVYDNLESALEYAYRIKGEGRKYILLENDLPDNY